MTYGRIDADQVATGFCLRLVLVPTSYSSDFISPCATGTRTGSPSAAVTVAACASSRLSCCVSIHVPSRARRLAVCRIHRNNLRGVRD